MVVRKKRRKFSDCHYCTAAAAEAIDFRFGFLLVRKSTAQMATATKRPAPELA